MKLKLWLLLIPSVFILVGAGIWIGWTLINASNHSDSMMNAENGPSVTQESDDFSTEVVNTPVSESIIVFKDESIEFQNGHDFIRYFHNFYNETLGWGRLHSASYSQQRDQAETLKSILEKTDVENEALKEDWERMLMHAETVIKEDNRDSMRTLHRYFHDLDIILNGYDYSETFGVTTFRGN